MSPEYGSADNSDSACYLAVGGHPTFPGRVEDRLPQFGLGYLPLLVGEAESIVGAFHESRLPLRPYSEAGNGGDLLASELARHAKQKLLRL